MFNSFLCAVNALPTSVLPWILGYLEIGTGFAVIALAVLFINSDQQHYYLRNRPIETIVSMVVIVIAWLPFLLVLFVHFFDEA